MRSKNLDQSKLNGRAEQTFSGRVDAMAHLKRRDHRALFIFSVLSILLVGAGEWAAFQFDMVRRYGIEPVLLRAAAYIFLAVVLWTILLRNDRKRIERLIQRNEEYFRSLLYAYEEALGLKDWYTGGHGRRVAAYSGSLARVLQLPTSEVERIEHAALLHDIGKIGVPDRILTKAGALNDEEWEAMKVHSQAGARIISIADTLDAITTDRSYRKSDSFSNAIAEIQKGSSTYFDPLIVEGVCTPRGISILEQEYLKLKGVRS
jgi:PAS domain-containing protein